MLGYRPSFFFMATSNPVQASAATELPDPYYGGPEGFEQVLDMAEDACTGLLVAIKKKLGL